MGTTSPDSLYYPDALTPQNPLIYQRAAAESVQAALNAFRLRLSEVIDELQTSETLIAAINAIIASDPEFFGPVEAAIAAAIADLELVETSSPQVWQLTETEDGGVAIVDRDDNIGFILDGKTGMIGGALSETMQTKYGSFGRRTFQMIQTEDGGVAWADPDGNLAEASFSGVTGRLYPEAVDAIAARMPASSRLVAPDMVYEWWNRPGCFVREPYDRYLVTGISATGEICVAEYVAGEATKRVVVGRTAIPDDHNAGSMLMVGGRVVVFWSTHSDERNWKMKVGSTDGSIESLAEGVAEVIEGPIDFSERISYTDVQWIEGRSSAPGDTSPGAQDTLWVFSRIGDPGWIYIEVSINRRTGAVTAHPRQRLIGGGHTQTYAITAMTETGKIRLAYYPNPQAAVHWIKYIEIDPETLTATVPGTSFSQAVSHHTATAPIIDAPTVPNAVADTPAGRNRRLFYVGAGPMPPAILYGEWDIASPDAGTAYLMERIGGAWVRTTLGPLGARVGYVVASNYVDGWALPDYPRVDSRVVGAYHVGGVGHLVVGRRGAGGVYQWKTLLTSDRHMIRPWITSGRHIFYNEVEWYHPTNYIGTKSTIKSVLEA